ncbi:MAG TPA: SDR family oxidoreductase [Pyrinomonadaceae bacterium]|nr:SDR family oxidoreductase [Pyrinomonadaceae bacterium]
MSKIIVLGAAGSLGKHVVRQAAAAGHKVTAIVRSPEKIRTEISGIVALRAMDLAEIPLSGLSDAIHGHDALINTAGNVADGQVFVDLLDRIVAAVEAIPAVERPVSWFMAGAGLLDIDGSGRRGVDLPKIGTTYWPHRANFERIASTSLDWRILCPGPMVEGPGMGIDKLRTSVDTLPVAVPLIIKKLPNPLVLPFFASRIQEMIVAYEDAAALMLANLQPGGSMSHRRIGLALPVGMRGRKQPQPTARAVTYSMR